MSSPEELAREKIDALLQQCGWILQSRSTINLSATTGSSDDLDHDYLWRCMKCLPNRGHIGIFNRSYYEEVLVVRVHPEFLAKQKLVPLSTVSVQPAQIGNNTVTNVFR